MEKYSDLPKAAPLRERKKALLRRTILASAEKLFEEHGYDQVTVADIADAADVSVKTLFTYFRSKEDLAFQDSQLIDAVLEALATRSRKTSPAQAVLSVLVRALGERADVIASLDAFQRGYGESDALRSRLLRLWAEYEERIAAALAGETERATPKPDQRFLAAQLVTLMRSATWKETRELAARARRPEAAKRLVQWLTDTARKIDRGERR